MKIITTAITELLCKQTKVQTLIFDKEHFPNKEDATKWAREHNVKSANVEETSTSFRLRQIDPSKFIEGSFRTIEITTGVKAVIGRPKE